ncbi:MAG: YIP1 family protein [Oscillospiraceae bacterium]|nr:YIP1 family protein [Oscillospiraceae bacterium]
MIKQNPRWGEKAAVRTDAQGKWKRRVIGLVAALILAGFGGLAVSADSSGKTYIYTNRGQNVEFTPDAYTYDRVYYGADTGANAFLNPQDLFVDQEGNVYIADTGNNRIVALDQTFQTRFILSEFTVDGVVNTFNEPRGLYVTAEGDIYVADTLNSRVVVFDKTGGFRRELKAPEIDVLTVNDAQFIYSPTALAVDAAGRLYVVAQSVSMGIIQLSPEGVFQGFVGVQRVSYNAVDYFWKQLLTATQAERMTDYVPTEYNNINLDKNGFLYVTASAINFDDLVADIASPSESPGVAVLRRLNPGGNDVLRRKGGISISGDLMYKGGAYSGPSVIVDAAVGPAGMYTLLDANRGKYFTYSADGEMLYAFSVTGTQKTNAAQPTAIFYQNGRLLVLDAATGKIIVYKPTEYGELLQSALTQYDNYQFEESVETWKRVLSLNANMDMAYIGIGKAYQQDGKFDEAMAYFKLAEDKNAYSVSYGSKRQILLNKYFIFLLAGALVCLALLFKALNAVKKHNVQAEQNPEIRGKMSSRLLYGYHAIFHPMDGFWCLKHEKRGSVQSATVLLLLTVLSLVCRTFFSGYLYTAGNGAGEQSASFLHTVFGLAAPVLLWVAANWCITTLMDGEGSIKDIYISTCYALVPIFLTMLIATGLSHFLTGAESMYIGFLTNLGYFAAVLLIFFGAMVTHNYSLSKNVAASVLSLLGMAVIVFLILLVLTVVQRMFGFIGLVYKELLFRS